MKIEVIVRVNKTEGYGSTTVAESTRTLVIDDDFRVARRAMSDATSDVVTEVESRLRHLGRIEEEKAEKEADSVGY
jgi:hypothetical protein